MSPATDDAEQISSSGRTVALTGASGMIGSALSEALRRRGDQVIHLVRRASRVSGPQVREISWQPGQRLDPELLRDVDAVVNLAGAGLGDARWSEERKRELVSSRVDSTTTIARAVADAAESDGDPPRLLSASAVGVYGDRGGDVLTEDSPVGTGFLADLCRDWEAATAPAEEAGAAVTHLRTGIVLSPEGGALGKVLPLVKLGLGGPLGSGRQYWAWISLQDHVRAMLFLLDHPELTGPVDLTGPEPAMQKDVVKALARAAHRPAVLPAPAPAMRLVLGEMADEMVLASQRALPVRLREAGFGWDHPTLDSAASWVLDRA